MSNIKKNNHTKSRQAHSEQTWISGQARKSKRMSNTHVMLFPTDYQPHHSPPDRPTADRSRLTLLI